MFSRKTDTERRDTKRPCAVFAMLVLASGLLQADITVTQLANEGVIISNGETRIMIDGMVVEPYSVYGGLPDSFGSDQAGLTIQRRRQLSHNARWSTEVQGNPRYNPAAGGKTAYWTQSAILYYFAFFRSSAGSGWKCAWCTSISTRSSQPTCRRKPRG